VVSLDHEVLVDLFREENKLAVELLRRCARIEVDHACVALTSIDLAQVVPVEYRADAVVVLRDSTDRPVAGLIVEVQLEEKARKLLTWPAYVAILRAKLDCVAMLVVVAPDPAVARWASRPIELGHPGFQLTPIVIGFEDVPRIHDRAVALALPQLSVLSTVAHKELPLAEIALEAISPLPKDQKRLYYDYIMRALPAGIRQKLEVRMPRYKSEFALSYYGEGMEKGIEKGRGEGLRAAVVAFARARIIDLPEDILAVLDTVTDPGVLTQLVASLSQTHTAVEARAALDRVCHRPSQ
jgi:hypothetical protein